MDHSEKSINLVSKRSKSSHATRRGTTATASAIRKGSTLWTDPKPLMPSTRPGSDLWTGTRPGKREIWSWITYAVNGKGAIKLFVLETSIENKKRFVGPTFHSPQEAKKNCVDNGMAWPGDRKALDLNEVRCEGLLKAWSTVWSPEVDQAVKSCSESIDRFLELFNEVEKGLHVKVPKTFTDQLILQVHKEHGAKDPLKYGQLGGYFFPDRPSSLTEEDEERDPDPMPEKEEEVEEAAKEPEKPKQKRSIRNRVVIFFDEAKKGAKMKFKPKKKDKANNNEEKEEKVEEAEKEAVEEEEAKDKSSEDDLKSLPENQMAKKGQPEETPTHRRIYAFASVTVATVEHKVLKYAFVRSRMRGDHYFVAVTPDFGNDDVEALKTFFEQDKAPYPDFEFDAKWMLEELDEPSAASANRTRSLF